MQNVVQLAEVSKAFVKKTYGCKIYIKPVKFQSIHSLTSAHLTSGLSGSSLSKEDQNFLSVASFSSSPE